MMLQTFFTVFFIGVNAVASVVANKQDGGHDHDNLPPVVFLPGWGITTMLVTVQDQTVAPECPANGTFDHYFTIPADREFSTTFTQECQDKLLTMRFDPSKPLQERFSEQEGVTVTIKNYGKTDSCPFLEGTYKFLESHGYVRNKDIVVAGYDCRYNPDQNGFVERTKDLIEQTYHNNGNTPVHLVSFSNGARFVRYLLTHVPPEWKHQHIHGQTLWAGNYVGEGAVYSLLFSGFNMFNASRPTTISNAQSSAKMYRSLPSSYGMISNPRFYMGANATTVVRLPNRSYTAEQFKELFTDAGLTIGLEVTESFFQLVDANPVEYPNVDTYVEVGTGIPTVVGVELPSLDAGQFFTAPILGTGDGVVSDTNNDSIQAWADMPCYQFQFYKTENLRHAYFDHNSDVLTRLWMHLNQKRSICHHEIDFNPHGQQHVEGSVRSEF